MLELDRTALYCDLAETYHVYGFDSLPLEEIAMLASGLREDSRIKQKMGGVSYVPIFAINAMIADNLTLIRHGMANDSREPFLFTDLIYKKNKAREGFESSDDFKKAWANIMEE